MSFNVLKHRKCCFLQEWAMWCSVKDLEIWSLNGQRSIDSHKNLLGTPPFFSDLTFRHFGEDDPIDSSVTYGNQNFGGTPRYLDGIGSATTMTRMTRLRQDLRWFLRGPTACRRCLPCLPWLPWSLNFSSMGYSGNFQKMAMKTA